MAKLRFIGGSTLSAMSRLRLATRNASRRGVVFGRYLVRTRARGGVVSNLPSSRATFTQGRMEIVENLCIEIIDGMYAHVRLEWCFLITPICTIYFDCM